MSRPVRHLASISLALGAVGLLLTACGGPPAPGVASSGTSTTTTAPSPTTDNAQFARFGSCMRAHNEPQFQNPTANGTTFGFTVSPSLGIGTPRYASAVTACERYLPLAAQNFVSPDLPPGMQRVTQADEVDYLKAVACLRTHGFSSVPDPTFGGGRVRISLPKSIDKNSPRFQRAVATCRKLIPAGLPYNS